MKNKYTPAVSAAMPDQTQVKVSFYSQVFPALKTDSLGLVALWHVESSQTSDQTHVLCLGRQILNHSTTGEVPAYSLKL